MSELYRVALLVGNKVVATSSDETAVRISAAMIARHPDVQDEPVFAPIDDGRQTACRRVAIGAV